MADLFRDFIPEGEDTGGLGEGGFRDYVPPAEPKPQTVEKEEKPKHKPKPKPKKK